MGKRILVIDDEPDLVHLVSIFLGAAGFEVIGADNGREGIEKIEQVSPDLVICDMVMPNMDGIETVKAIRANPRTRSLPVIMLSARGQTEDVNRALTAGANDYIIKPFRGAEIVEMVKRYLSQEQLTEICP
ncbi:MAG: response regulator [Chloroflexi bacterium]|nr:response regulator [Chloroflexota bacterium]